MQPKEQQQLIKFKKNRSWALFRYLLSLAFLCVFMTALLILNQAGGYIYYSTSRAIKYPILTKPGYYDHILKDEREDLEEREPFSNSPKVNGLAVALGESP